MESQAFSLPSVELTAIAEAWPHPVGAKQEKTIVDRAGLGWGVGISGLGYSSELKAEGVSGAVPRTYLSLSEGVKCSGKISAQNIFFPQAHPEPAHG